MVVTPSNHHHLAAMDEPGGELPNKYDGMIVEIVEKHPELKVTNMGVAPANFIP